MKIQICLLFTAIVLLMESTMAQTLFDVQITIHNRDQSAHIGEEFYLTGSFNSWKPAEILVGAIPKYGESIQVTIHDVPKGLLEYKFTRGSWETLSSTAKGNLEGPIKVVVESDTVVSAYIDGWRDDFPLSTASPQVHLLDSAFYFPTLDVRRRVWIYLPEGYAESSERYPVIYMHDGQDLFDEATSKGRIGPLEWRVDEAIDAADHKAIVVAIAHAEDIQQRQNEYFVRPTSRFPQPLGEAYLSDIVQILKPHVDQHYRTLPDRQHTAMAGSSVGGLLTFYAGLLHPDVFGTVSVMSPSIWLDEGNIDLAITQNPLQQNAITPYFYIYGGGNENRIKPDGSRVRMHDDIAGITEMMEQSGRKDFHVVIEPDGRHGAWYWQKAFPYFYQWWRARLIAPKK